VIVLLAGKLYLYSITSVVGLILLKFELRVKKKVNLNYFFVKFYSVFVYIQIQ